MPSPWLLPIRNKTVYAGERGTQGHGKGCDVSGWKHRIPFEKEFIQAKKIPSIGKYVWTLQIVDTDYKYQDYLAKIFL